MKKRKMCAVCFDKIQSNVIFAWRRDRDGVIFNVCASCAESQRVNENSVQIKKNKTYSTIR
jgi:hypothetical protein